MILCSCGFANPDGAATCLMCASGLGNAAATPCANPTAADKATVDECGLLALEDMRTRERICIDPPGGIIGRAGDFSPDSFSAQVSGVHLIAQPTRDEVRSWTLEFVGRNETSISSGETWIPMRAATPYAVFGGELIKMADMLFRLEILREDPRAACDKSPAGAADGCSGDNTSTHQPSSEPQGSWVVVCPVCATSYPVPNEHARARKCTVCSDPLDRMAVTKVAPRWVESEG